MKCLSDSVNQSMSTNGLRLYHTILFLTYMYMVALSQISRYNTPPGVARSDCCCRFTRLRDKCNSVDMCLMSSHKFQQESPKTQHGPKFQTNATPIEVHSISVSLFSVTQHFG